jgi:hypothetical protein
MKMLSLLFAFIVGLIRVTASSAFAVASTPVSIGIDSGTKASFLESLSDTLRYGYGLNYFRSSQAMRPEQTQTQPGLFLGQNDVPDLWTYDNIALFIM